MHIVNKKKPEIETLNRFPIGNYFSNNEFLHRKCSTQISNCFKSDLNKIHKVCNFSNRFDSGSNKNSKNYRKNFKQINFLYKDNLLTYPFNEHKLNSEIFNGSLNSEINENKYNRNESFYFYKMNYFSKIAHEFKTSLNAIIGLIIEIKNNPSIISKVLSNIDIINNLSNYLIFLISDITQFINQNTNNNLVIITETVSLKSIIEFCYEILNTLLICKNSNSNVKTNINFDNRLETIGVLSNDMRLKQILLNFISNSVKFTKSGFIELKVKLKINHIKKYIKISVIDSGVGIREEDQKKIFKEIYCDFKNELNNYGSGLGLNICKFIAEKLNHSLKFKSIYGKGSKFSLLILESCLKLDKNNQYNFHLDSSELNNIYKFNYDKLKKINSNSQIKESLIYNKFDQNKKENFFLNLNSIEILRK